MITFRKWKNDVTSFDTGLTAIPPLKSAMFPLLKEARLTEASPPEAGYSPRTPAEAVKQCRRDGLCRVLWSWWPLTQEYSPEARNIIWLPAFKLELQSSKAQFRSKWAIFVLCDLEIWQMTMNKANLRDLIAATGLVILLKLDSKHRFFTPCHLKIKCMTPKNYRAPLLYFIKLCASFQIHQWIQTGVTARKRQFFWAVWPCNLTCDLKKQ